jgi:hypothetical protein
MSGVDQKRHFDCALITSGLPRLADIPSVSRHVSKVPIPEVRVSFGHQGSVLAIGLVLVAASEAWVIAEPLIAVEAAHAMRMSAMAGKAVGFMAMVPLEAFLTVAMPLAFSNKNEGARSIRW